MYNLKSAYLLLMNDDITLNKEYFVRLEAHMPDDRTLSSEHVIFRVGGKE